MANARSIWKGPYISWSLIRHWIRLNKASLERDTHPLSNVGGDFHSPVSFLLSKNKDDFKDLKKKKDSKLSLQKNSTTSSVLAPPQGRGTNSNKKVYRIWSRNSTILPSFVNSNFQIHNGKTFIKVLVTQDMVGHKFGEFSMTRKTILKSSSKKKKGKK